MLSIKGSCAFEDVSLPLHFVKLFFREIVAKFAPFHPFSFTKLLYIQSSLPCSNTIIYCHKKPSLFLSRHGP